MEVDPFGIKNIQQCFEEAPKSSTPKNSITLWLEHRP
jgi:hypothetical protein